MIYIHLKTGKEYKLVSLKALDATNGQEERGYMILYKRKDQYFVREYKEFTEKFKLK